jgi:hypothetical protein
MTTIKRRTTVSKLNTMTLSELVATCTANQIGISYDSMSQKVCGIVMQNKRV